jgi:PleD family two-component response regulator
MREHNDTRMNQREPRDLPLKDRPAVVILVVHEPLRRSLSVLLQENGYAPEVAANPQEVMRILRNTRCATVFVDCEGIGFYGAGICAKFKVACQYCRVVLLCDKSLEAHRRIIKEAMEIGIYACLLPPYEDWEVLTMVSYFPRMRTI